MDMRPAQQGFLEESRELLRAMEQALLALEKSPQDEAAVNEVFRAAHTIKGSAGMFGYEPVVAFTHRVESVLAALRAGTLAAQADLVALLLSCVDHIATLLDALAPEDAAAPAPIQAAGDTLRAQLESFAGSEQRAGPVSRAPAVQEVPVEVIGARPVASDAWHVSVRFGKDVLRDGLDPLSVLRYLGTVGAIQAVSTILDGLPDARSMDPEACYLGLEIDLTGPLDKAQIEAAFEFVRADSVIRILPPHSKIADYIALLESLPEDHKRIGELLVASGALTAHELEEGLRLQERSAAAADVAKPKIGKILVDEGVVANDLVHAALEKQASIREHKAGEGSFVRVRADKLDELITLVGELVIAGAGTRLLAQRSSHPEVAEAASTLERLVQEMRDRALALRMVPIAETFNRFRRVVRDVGRELGKEIDLELSGVETELDKSMVERIADPLMHLVRNALDHGIEPAEERRRQGKRATGTLRMSAWHDSGSIVIEVSDDGRGVERKRVLARAVERGLVGADAVLDDAQILDLILEPGFSTAAQVTSISGRGIGMSVVKTNVEALRGTLSIVSAEGEGTMMAMRLPLTLAIIEGFLVAAGRTAYVVPLEMVDECLELSAADREALRDKSFINLRGEVLPVLRLREVFQLEAEPAKRENIVVVRYAGRRAGIVVDRLLGEFQTVIKPLGRMFARLQGISGSTILGSGELALILDVQALVERATRFEASRFAGSDTEKRKKERSVP
jgi:two-component system chemotaxis sensor kinase CheA